MILDQRKTTLAYRCPSCLGVTTSMIGAFSLSGDLFKLKCDCGNSSLSVEKMRDGKFRLTVPCLACPKPHNYILSREVFFGSDVFVIPCSVCGIDICFIGKENEVSSAIKQSNDEIAKLLGDASIESLKADENENALPDPQILDILSFVIADLNDEGKIYCRCPEGHGDYELSVGADTVAVRCKCCGASKELNARSISFANDFLTADSLHLK